MPQIAMFCLQNNTFLILFKKKNTTNANFFFHLFGN